MRRNGVTITEVRYAAFRKLMDPVFATMQGKIGASFMNRVIAAAGN